MTTLQPLALTKPAEAKPHSAWGIASSASLATMFTKSLLHPIDTLKIRVQTTTSAARRGASCWPELRATYRGKWGPTYLYAGLPAKLVVYVPYQALYMCTYDGVRSQLPEPGACSAAQRAAFASLSAIAAESVSAGMRVPMETVKLWLQTTTDASATASLRRMWRAGPSPLASIQTVARFAVPQTLVADIPYGIVFWISYESIRPALLRRSPAAERRAGFAGGGWLTLLAGGSSGFVASAVTVPLDRIRARAILAAAHRPEGVRPPCRAVAAQMYREGGARAFFRGGGWRMLWVSSNSAVYFCAFECIKAARR